MIIILDHNTKFDPKTPLSAVSFFAAASTVAMLAFTIPLVWSAVWVSLMLVFGLFIGWLDGLIFSYATFGVLTVVYFACVIGTVIVEKLKK